MALKPVRKIRKENSNCAIFGALSYSGRPLSGKLAVEGIMEAENARGGTYGNGVMFAHADKGKRGKTLCVWARDELVLGKISAILREEGIKMDGFAKAGAGDIYHGTTEAEYLPLLSAVVRANSEVSLEDGRIISFGHGLKLFKGLESLSVLDEVYGLREIPATAMIAHTRYPTGSQPMVARAHPFNFGNVGIVHNGDVTSYMANVAACEARLAEMYHMFSNNGVEPFLSQLRKSWAKTDSEVIAGMMYAMLKTGLISEPGLSIGGIMNALVPTFDNALTGLMRGSTERERLDKIAMQYRGFGLDGPVSSIALITFEDEVQLLAFRDRNAFRPLRIVVDHKNGNVFVASELRQIISATGIDTFSSAVETYSPEPGKFLWVSSKSGIVTSGRSRRPYIAVPDLSEKEIKEQIKGKPNQFAGARIDDHRTYVGILGSHGGSYSDGDGTLEIVGSMQDNCFEASSLSNVVCHGNASMMLGNAFQGKRFFVRGSVDSRAFQQLRPFNGHQPTAIIGETAGSYLGKMMSGGTIIVLGLGSLGREDIDTSIVGEFTGTGMVGGRIYIRDYVIDDYIKRPPQRRDVIAACGQLRDEEIITESALREIRHNPLDIKRISKIIETTGKNPDNLEKAIQRLSRLFDSTFMMERRGLHEDEIDELGTHLEEYFRIFALKEDGLKRLLAANYTIIRTR